MANLALIRGAGMAADRYVSVSNAIEKGAQKFKSALEERKAEAERLKQEKNREELIKLKDYASLGALQTDGVPEAWKGWYNQEALNIKEANKLLVNQRGEMDQFQYMDELNGQKTKINQLQNSIAALKQYSEAYKEISENDDFSDALTSSEKSLINDIVQLNGVPVFKNGKMYFKSAQTGEEVAFDDLPELRTKDYEAHNKIEKDIIKLMEGASKSGMFIGGGEDFEDSAYLQGRVDDYFRNLNLKPDQALGLAMDFLKMGGPNGELATTFKKLTDEEATDFNNDGTIDKDEYIQSFKNIQLPNDFVERVKDQYKTVAANTSKNLKVEYDRVNKAKQKTTSTKEPRQFEIEYALKQNELLATSMLLKPLFKGLPNTAIDANTTQQMISYANENIPGIEIYQQRNSDGELVENSYAIEVNGKIKPFTVGETTGASIAKFIRDLYGYTTTDTLKYFPTSEKEDSTNDDKDEFSEFETNSITAEDIQKTQNEIAFAQLNKQSKRDSVLDKIQKESTRPEQVSETISRSRIK
tara:strand:+ start:17519 stop:19102 length:1584 start_codon:yes stop_codon:yes gene_type:complete